MSASSSPAHFMSMRLRYLPLHEATEGMVLGAPLMLAEHGVITFQLPAGHILTATNLQQMNVHHAEFVCIEEEDSRSDQEREMAWCQAEERLQYIFRAADLGDSASGRLYRAVLAYRRG